MQGLFCSHDGKFFEPLFKFLDLLDKLLQRSPAKNRVKKLT